MNYIFIYHNRIPKRLIMTSERTVNIVVISLSIIGILSVIGCIYLLKLGKEATVIAGLAGTAIGSLATMLATTESRSRQTSVTQNQSVETTNGQDANS